MGSSFLPARGTSSLHVQFVFAKCCEPAQDKLANTTQSKTKLRCGAALFTLPRCSHNLFPPALISTKARLQLSPKMAIYEMAFSCAKTACASSPCSLLYPLHFGFLCSARGCSHRECRSISFCSHQLYFQLHALLFPRRVQTIAPEALNLRAPSQNGMSTTKEVQIQTSC